MGSIKQRMFMYSFSLICISTTLFMCIYWFYEFSLNEDLTVVSYREYQQTVDDFFPTISLCFKNPFLKERLSEYGVNESTYFAFLKGQYFSNDMMDINYNNVTIDILDYLKGYRIYFRNSTIVKVDSGLSIQSKKRLTFVSFNGFTDFYNTFYKCFGLEIPKFKDLMIFRIMISNKIYPNGLRPTKNGVRTYIHLPKQFLLSSFTDKYSFPYRSSKESYKMRFYIHAVDIDNNRDKKEKKCSRFWKDYDDRITKAHKNKTGCNIPYQEQEKGLPMCKSKEEMYRSKFFINIAEKHNYEKPCKTMGNVRIEFIESIIKTTKLNQPGYFWLSIQFPQNKFKEIAQTRYIIVLLYFF